MPVVPADGPDPTDLYNSCTGPGHNPAHLDDLETVVIGADGEEVTGYLFGDNYYELYVNGTIVARDNVVSRQFSDKITRQVLVKQNAHRPRRTFGRGLARQAPVRAKRTETGPRTDLASLHLPGSRITSVLARVYREKPACRRRSRDHCG